MRISVLDFVAFTAAAGGLSMLLGMLLLRLTLTRRVKKELKPKGEYWETGTLDFGFLNTILFAWAFVLPYVQRSDMFRTLYPGINAREYFKWFEKVLAYSLIVGLVVALLFGFVFVLIEP